MSLREAGYIVHTASDAAEALHVFRRTHVDLVLLDLQLPNRDGHSVCVEIRKHSRTPIIIMSAYGAPDDIVYSFSQGAHSTPVEKTWGAIESKCRRSCASMN
jgi:DNA-binding response OmpR family regulator